SMFRRLAPVGIGTTIMVTGNLRAWRHIISMRTSVHAEEEIRLVGDRIAEICKKEFPNVFQDMYKNKESGAWVSDHSKV
ncbi:MAG: FAD-dependent thymidylate synthase, partial [Desulfobacteraceae bacterium]|nr:FAD-dependent thymidylate synthase [Desulfobacteraceae bacterium]